MRAVADERAVTARIAFERTGSARRDRFVARGRFGLGHWFRLADDNAGRSPDSSAGPLDEPAARPRKQVSAERSEMAVVIKVDEMRDLQHFRTDFNQIERVLLPLPASTAPRGCCPALNDNHASFSILEGKEVERIADICAMQVSAENQLDPHVKEPRHGPGTCP